MSDLIQFQEEGFQTPTGVDWCRGTASMVTGANRRRILDRDATEPREDGWAYEIRHLDADCVAVTRIRWDNTRLYDEATLARHLKGWAS